MTIAYINRIASAVPDHEVHVNFVRFAGEALQKPASRVLFERMANRAQIERRWSCLAPPKSGVESLDGEGFYRPGQFPSTADRMARYEIAAPALGAEAVEQLGLDRAERKRITHLIVASCTGFSAPGVDLELLERCGLNPSVERTVIGFMGCHAAMNALKIAHHIVRSTPTANVLVVCLELCTLHFQETADIDRLLTFLLFGDGCAAALISAAPEGIALDSFHAELVRKAADQITWNIRDAGFDMVLSGRVPSTITSALRESSARVLGGRLMDSIDIWAVHPGGRSILDAVEGAFELEDSALAASRAVLRDYGNMSSATILFVLERLMRDRTKRGASGCALAFGPGLTAETMQFRMGSVMIAVDFSRRNELSELMDADDTDFATFRECLVDLASVNRLTLAYRPTLSFLKRLAAKGALPRRRAVRIVDVGSGSGDMLRRIDRWATARGYKFDLVGVDLNPWSAKTAAQLTQENPRLRFVTANIFDYQPAAPIDIVISSLFTHHLDNEAIVKFLRWMEANARIGWFVNDLQRHPLAYHAFKHAAHALRFHHFVQHDGPISIARAFSAADWQGLLGAADIAGAHITPHIPFRLCVSQIKPK